MTMNLEVAQPIQMSLSALFAARLVHGSKCSLGRQSSACQGTEKQESREGDENKKNQSSVILSAERKHMVFK